MNTSRPNPIYGKPSRLVCWLPAPSLFDKYIPEYCKLRYVFSALATAGHGKRYRHPVYKTTSQGEAWDYTRMMYQLGAFDGLLWMHTEWVTPDGQMVHKLPLEPVHYVQEGIPDHPHKPYRKRKDKSQ